MVALTSVDVLDGESLRCLSTHTKVDGNGWSSRFNRLIMSGSVVVKSTIYPEWNSVGLTTIEPAAYPIGLANALGPLRRKPAPLPAVSPLRLLAYPNRLLRRLQHHVLLRWIARPTYRRSRRRGQGDRGTGQVVRPGSLEMGGHAGLHVQVVAGVSAS